MSETLARSVSSVSVKLNGCDAEGINPWSLGDLQHAAETFSEKVKENPSKTLYVPKQAPL